MCSNNGMASFRIRTAAWYQKILDCVAILDRGKQSDSVVVLFQQDISGPDSNRIQNIQTDKNSELALENLFQIHQHEYSDGRAQLSLLTSSLMYYSHYRCSDGGGYVDRYTKCRDGQSWFTYIFWSKLTLASTVEHSHQCTEPQSYCEPNSRKSISYYLYVRRWTPLVLALTGI